MSVLKQGSHALVGSVQQSESPVEGEKQPLLTNSNSFMDKRYTILESEFNPESQHQELVRMLMSSLVAA